MPTAPVAALVPLLNHENADIRKAAARALGNWQKAAKDAIPALEAAMEDEDPDVREAARRAIFSIETGY